MQIGSGIRISGGVIISQRLVLPDPGGAAPLLSKLPGLYRRSYGGYYFDQVGFFDTATLRLRGISNPYIQLSGFDGGDAFSVQWLGYFKPPTTDTYTFYSFSDDSSYIWLGDTAVSGYSITNSVVNNGGIHTTRERTGRIQLTAGVDQYYPMRIQYGDYTGAQTMSVSYSTPSILKTNNFNNLIYYNPDTLGI